MVDYVIISAGQQSNVTDFRVGSLQPYSDHCPLIFVLKAAIVLPSMEPSPICEFPLTDTQRWKKENFISNLEENGVTPPPSLTGKKPPPQW